MFLLRLILGRPLANRELSERKIEAFEGVPAMGLDALFVGPTDLSIDLGTEANRPRGPFREAVQAIADAAIANGKAAGVLVRDAVQAADYMEMGYTFIALGSDRGLIASGMQRNAKALSEAAGAQAARSGATEAAQ